ncbi:MAG: DNA-binding protein [Calothrix sp. MO_167.B12]|nr:DNA-binding protein [Calothrix sp. MO_167.B12]
MNKIVGTTEAAFLLNISISRVKVLLQQQRIKGAKKAGRVWKIPLIKGIPQVQERHRGLKGTWRRKRCHKTTKIQVNKHQINHNRKHKTLEPVITVRQGNRKTYCHIAQINGSCRIVYQPDNPLSCGAVVWIEVLPDTVVIPQLLTPMEV